MQIVDYVNEFVDEYVDIQLWIKSHDGKAWRKTNVAEEAMLRMLFDCIQFVRNNWETLHTAYEMKQYRPVDAAGDFLYARNNYMGGFADRELGNLGDKLIEASKAFGKQALVELGNGRVGF